MSTSATAYFHCSGVIASTTAWSCSSTTACVLFASRSSSVSPQQKITLSPASIAARVLIAISLDVSPKMLRRSEWPENRDRS